MARIILNLLGWIKTRKGILSLTLKGRKALSAIDTAANNILRFSLEGVGLETFDNVEDDRIGNLGLAYSVWVLYKHGEKWHTGDFYEKEYQKIFNFPSKYSIYESRVYKRLFYWLGLVEKRPKNPGELLFQDEYKKTDLLPMIFSFKKN